MADVYLAIRDTLRDTWKAKSVNLPFGSSSRTFQDDVNKASRLGNSLDRKKPWFGERSVKGL